MHSRTPTTPVAEDTRTRTYLDGCTMTRFIFVWRCFIVLLVYLFFVYHTLQFHLCWIYCRFINISFRLLYDSKPIFVLQNSSWQVPTAMCLLSIPLFMACKKSCHRSIATTIDCFSTLKSVPCIFFILQMSGQQSIAATVYFLVLSLSIRENQPVKIYIRSLLYRTLSLLIFSVKI
jgi:hypothetical protein